MIQGTLLSEEADVLQSLAVVLSIMVPGHAVTTQILISGVKKSETLDGRTRAYFPTSRNPSTGMTTTATPLSIVSQDPSTLRLAVGTTPSASR